MTQYYFDYVDGNDGNDGLTPANAKQHPSTAVGLMLADNIISFKRGVVWPRNGWYWMMDIDGKALAGPCTLNDYGAAEDPPTFDNNDYENTATGWSHLGSGRWSKSWPEKVDRVMFGGNAAALSTGGLARATSTATDATLQWFWTGGVLHIFTGDTGVSPPVHYGGLAIVSERAGGPIRFRSCTNFIVERIRTFGGQLGGWIFETNGADNADMVFTDVEALHPGIICGFRIRSLSTTWGNRRLEFVRPIADMKTDATENEGSASRWGGSDGIGISHTWDDLIVTDPTIRRFRHSGINCYDEGSHTPGRLDVTAGPNFGVIDCSEIEYGRALSVAGSNAAMDVHISGMKSIGQLTRSQFGGKCVISGCSWKSMRWSDLPGFESSQCAWFQSWNTSPGNNYMLDVTFQNNLIENCQSESIGLARGSADAGSFNADTVKLYNNTIVDETSYVTARTIRTFDLGQGHPANQLVKNNNIITPASGGDHVNWDNIAYSVNERTGFTGNVENVEGYVNRAGGDYHPTDGGGLKWAGVLGATGALDNDAIAFHATTPSIAPLEFVIPALVALAVSDTLSLSIVEAAGLGKIGDLPEPEPEPEPEPTGVNSIWTKETPIADSWE